MVSIKHIALLLLASCSNEQQAVTPAHIDEWPCMDVSFMRTQFNAIGEVVLDEDGEPLVREVHPIEPCDYTDMGSNNPPEVFP